MKVYCQQCGSGVEYTYEKPNFCVKCGSNFSNIKTTQASNNFQRAKTNQSYITPKISESQDEEESLGNIRSMTQLDIDLGPTVNRSVKLSDIAGTRKEGESSELFEGTRQKINQKEFMEDFKREAGYYPSRQNIDEET